MHLSLKYAHLLSAAALLLVSCDSQELAERTLPNAMNYQLVTLAVATTSAEAPGNYNFDAYVTTRAVCQQGGTCTSGFIIVSDIQGADVGTPGASVVTMMVDEPTQFGKGDQYLFSVRITINETTEARIYTIHGYDEA